MNNVLQPVFGTMTVLDDYTNEVMGFNVAGRPKQIVATVKLHKQLSLGMVP